MQWQTSSPDLKSREEVIGFAGPYKKGERVFAMDALNLPRPGWMTEYLVLLEEQARRFIATEYVPHLDTWNEKGMYEREVWTKAGAAGLLCPAIPEEYGGAGGSFGHGGGV